MIDINYELYKVFYHVASTLNFSEASKQLYISQSAVSQSIKTLERKLDQTLFIRSTKKVQLTPEGEILMRHVEPAMNLIQKGETQLLDAASTGGQIRIGASDTICRYFLIPYLERFHKAFPGAHIKVINQTSMKCAELLRNGLVDLTVVNFPNNHLGTTTSVMRIKNSETCLSPEILSKTKRRNSDFLPTVEISHLNAGQKQYDQRISSSGISTTSARSCSRNRTYEQ